MNLKRNARAMIFCARCIPVVAAMSTRAVPHEMRQPSRKPASAGAAAQPAGPGISQRGSLRYLNQAGFGHAPQQRVEIARALALLNFILLDNASLQCRKRRRSLLQHLPHLRANVVQPVILATLKLEQNSLA